MKTRKATRSLVATTPLLVLVLVFGAAPASALPSHAYLGGSFGPGGPGGGTFSNPEAVTVDQSTGDVCVQRPC